jgi:hypothetical protein
MDPPDETRSVSVLLTMRLHMLRKREDYAPCGLAPQPLGPQVRENEFGSIAGLPSPNRHQPFFSAPRRTGEDDAKRSHAQAAGQLDDQDDRLHELGPLVAEDRPGAGRGSPVEWTGTGEQDNKVIGQLTLAKSPQDRTLKVKMSYENGGWKGSDVVVTFFELPGLSCFTVGGQDGGGRPDGPAYWNTVLFVYWAKNY